MARADSVIRVSIIGDAKKLIGALNTANTATGGLLASAAKGFIAFQAVDKAFDAVNSVVENADRAGDAMARLESSIGATDTAKLDAISGNFNELGVSAPDFLELTAGFAEFAAASGNIKPEAVAGMAAGVGQLAGAFGRVNDEDPNQMAIDISNFIAGGRGAAAAAKELGVQFDATATPLERYDILMEKLPGLMGAVTDESAGLDDKQSELQARWETLGKEVGPLLEQTLSNILGFILDEIDAIPSAIDGFEMLGAAIEGMARDALAPLARLVDLLNQVTGAGSTSGFDQNAVNRQRSRESSTVRNQQDFDERNGGTRTVTNRIGGP